MLKKLFVLVSAVLLALVPIAGAQRGTLQVAGLADSVEIIRDR